MLRPALLLPPKRLLTPRFDRTPLGAGRWPATRRSGAYLGGTLTRWLGPAFRTRHDAILASVRGCPVRAAERDRQVRSSRVSRSAFWVCRRFSAWSHTTEWGPSRPS